MASRDKLGGSIRASGATTSPLSPHGQLSGGSRSLRDYRDRLLTGGSSAAGGDNRSARSAGKTSDKGSSRQIKAEATVMFDKLVIAQQDIPVLLRSLVKAAENADCAAMLRLKLIDSEVQWLGVMQRVVGDGSNWCPEILPFLRLMVTGGTPLLHRAVIGGKLSSLLTIPSAPKDIVAAIVIQCLSSQENIELFLQRQEGLVNLAAAVSATNSSTQEAFSMVMLVANVLGRHPPSVTDLIGVKLDSIIASIGINAIPVVATQNGTLVMKAVLYCLRFFVRVRCDDTNFIETCLSLSAHAISVLSEEATDLCGDMCAVVKDYKFAKKNRNIFLNLVAIVAKVNSTRSLHIMRFISNYLQNCGKDVKLQFSVYGVVCAMMLTKSAPMDVPLALQLLELVLVAIAGAGVDALLRYIDFRVIRSARDVILTPGEGINTAAKIKFFTLYHTLTASGTPYLGVSRIAVSVNDAVGTHISDETYLHITSTPYRASSVKALDKKVDAHLRRSLQQAGVMEADEETTRAQVDVEQLAEWDGVIAAEAAQRGAIENTPNEIHYRIFDRNAIFFYRKQIVDLRGSLTSWEASLAEEIAGIKQQYIRDNNDLVAKISAELESKLKSNSLSERERTEARTRYRLKAEDQKRKLRLSKEHTLADRKWKQAQGSLFLQKMVAYAEREATNPLREQLFTCEYCEEIARGEGYSGVGAAVPAQENFISIAEEEAVAWRGIERQAAKVFAPQKYWLVQRREQLAALEQLEARVRLEHLAVVAFKLLELEFVEGLELFGVNRSKRMLPFHHLHLNVSITSFNASYGARPGDSLGSGLLRRVPSRRRSLSVLTSEARSLQICEEQEEVYRSEITQEGFVYLVTSIELFHCEQHEAKSRRFINSLVVSHFERVLQCEESLGRLLVDREYELMRRAVNLQAEEVEDRKMIEEEYAAVTEFLGAVEIGDGTALIDVLLTMIEPPSDTSFILSASQFMMHSSSGMMSV